MSVSKKYITYFLQYTLPNDFFETDVKYLKSKYPGFVSLSGRCVFFSKTGDSNAEDKDVCRALSPNFSEFVQNV